MQPAIAWDGEIATRVLLIVGAYLLGSVPATYLMARLLKGMDIRQYGSGTVGGSMVWEHVGRWAVVPVAVFDVGKAALPTWLALQLDLGMPVAIAAGLAAVVGHNWPIYLRFVGGRGMAAFAGMLLVIFPWGALWMLFFLAIGYSLGDSAPWFLACLITMPFFAFFVGIWEWVALLCVAMLIVTLMKRLEANRRPLPPPGRERWDVIWRRLVLDRDIASHRAWIDRGPEEKQEKREPNAGADDGST
jgi:glycerol-3-phosphate acyltransferase PlsY